MEILIDECVQTPAMGTNLPTNIANLGERLKWARENSANMSQSVLADKLGIKQPSVWSVESGETAKPKWLPEAAEILGVSYEWLLRGTNDESARQYNQRVLKPTESDLVPVYGYVSGGTDRIAINEGKIIEMRPRVAALEHVKDGYYLIVRGDSMAPALKNGHYLAVSPGHPPIKGEACAVCFKNGEAVVKIFMGMDDKNVIVEQLNPKKTLKYDRKEVETVAAGKGAVYYW